MKRISGRLVWAIISTTLEEAGIAAGVLWGLPQLGFHMPLPGLIALMAGWGVYSVLMYRMGTRVLEKKPLVGLPAMVGSQGKVTSRLHPDGVVRIKGELWQAISADDEVAPGEEVMVVGQYGLKLIVRKASLKGEE